MLQARESGTARLEEAVGALRAALAVFETAQASFYVTLTRINLASTERLLAGRIRSSVSP